MNRSTKLSWLFLFTLAILIRFFSFFPDLVEKYYSNGMYPYICQAQRVLFGWIPFSIGDIFYFICAIYLLRKLFVFFRTGVKRMFFKQLLIYSLRRVVFVSLLIYVLFNSLWGLNYNRLPMATQMGLQLEPYSTENLGIILGKLVNKLNASDSSARLYRASLSIKKTLFQEAIGTYATATYTYPALAYKFPSVKPSLFSYAGNYLGFTGYYNPFSGEAQANTTVPSFVQPFTTCHEIGHQLGYAKENEANFAGFLAARASVNPAFRYSVYFDMYAYAIRELYLRDSLLVKGFRDQLNQGVRDDFLTMRRFFKKYQNPIEPLISRLYAQYLRANQQPEGLRSYNEVVAMLVAYYRKYGEI